MFWSENPTASFSTISVQLQQPDVTLAELLDQDDILHECKSQNKKLIEFLERPNVIKELIDLIITEPQPDADPENSYRHPALASEIIALGLTGIMEKIAVDTELLKKLSSFLESDPPLNTLLASFFAKTFNVLLSRHCGQDWYSYQLICIRVLEFFKNNNVFHGLLNHIGTSAVMDTLQCIIRVEIMEQGILKWLDSQFCIENLIWLTCGTYKTPIDKCSTKIPSESSTNDVNISEEAECDMEYRLLMGKSVNAAQLLCNIIINGRDITADRSTSVDPDPLLEKCKDSATVTLLLTSIVSSPPKTKQLAIVNGIQVLLVLLNNVPGSIKPPSVDPNEINRIAELILPFLPALTDVLFDTPPSFKYGYSNSIEKPVGAARLAVIHLLEVLVSLDNPGVALAIVQNDIITVLFNMFMEYKWNNFLHAHVVNIITNICPTFMQKEIYGKHLFVDCKLLDKIVKAWEENDESQKMLKPRFGYMGHLIAIANCLNTHLEQYSELMEDIPSETKTKWTTLVTEKLDKVNAAQKLYLGGTHPLQLSNTSHHQQHTSQMSFVSYPSNEDFFNEYDDECDSFNDNRNIAQELFMSICNSQSQNQKINDMFLLTNVNTSLDNDSQHDEFEEVTPTKSFDQKILGLASKLSECDVQDNMFDKWLPSNSQSDWDSDDINAASDDVLTSVTVNSASPWRTIAALGNDQIGWADFSKFDSSTDLQNDLNSFNCDPYSTFDNLSFTQSLGASDLLENCQSHSADDPAISDENETVKSDSVVSVVGSEVSSEFTSSSQETNVSECNIDSKNVPEIPSVCDPVELQKDVKVVSNPDLNTVLAVDSLSKLEEVNINVSSLEVEKSSDTDKSDVVVSSESEISNEVPSEVEASIENMTDGQNR